MFSLPLLRSIIASVLGVSALLIVGLSLVPNANPTQRSPVSAARLFNTPTSTTQSSGDMQTFEVTISTDAFPIRWNASQGRHFGSAMSVPQGARVLVWSSNVERHPATQQPIRIRAGSVITISGGTEQPSSGTPLLTETAMPITTIE